MADFFGSQRQWQLQGFRLPAAASYLLQQQLRHLQLLLQLLHSQLTGCILCCEDPEPLFQF